MFIFAIATILFLASFYFKYRLTNKVLIGLVTVFSFFVVLDELYFLPDVKEGYGCVEGKKDVFRAMPKLLIIVDGKRKKYAIYDSNTGFKNAHIGECIRFKYYKNIYGNNIFLKVENERLPI